MAQKGFKELVVWRNAKNLAVHVYQISSQGKLQREFGLTNQLRKSAVSVASNLAEGDERGSNREAVRFFYMAKGSLAELRTQLQIASEVGLLASATYTEMDLNWEKLGSMIGKLIRARSGTAHR